MSNLLAYEVLENAKNQWPNNFAIHDEVGSMTFSELYDQVQILKSELTKNGVLEGHAVGVMAKNGRNIIVAIFAVIGCGATVMPMSHQLKHDEVQEILNEANLHFILDDLSGSSSLKSDIFIPLNHNGFQLITLENLIFPFAKHVEYPAFMRFTSGTTGKAKGVIVSHKSAIERIEGANKLLKLGPQDTVIWVLPIAYHFIVSILLYVRYGTAIAISRDFLPQNIIEITRKYKGTLLYASPMQVRLLSRVEEEEADLSSLNMVISTSAGISPDICIDFEKKYNIPVSQAYGIIEIGLPIINYSKSAENPEAVGMALPDYEVAIMDDDNNLLEDGKIGHLGIKGPGMFDAYLNPAIKRDAVLINGYFLTADFASRTSDGLIKVEGRGKSVINVSGNKVFPEEIESLLETLPEIKQAKISGVAHPIMGQIVQAEIIVESGYSVDIEAILTYCRKRLSTFKIPQKVLIVDKLEMTKTGKLVR